jgi:hypothetical protein
MHLSAGPKVHKKAHAGRSRVGKVSAGCKHTELGTPATTGGETLSPKVFALRRFDTTPKYTLVFGF